MGGGRNGCFWGAPILHLFVGKRCIFQGFGRNRSAPKTAIPTTTHPIPQTKFFSPTDSQNSGKEGKRSKLERARISDFSSRPWRNLPPTWVIHMATRRPAHNTPMHMDFLYGFSLKRPHVHVDRRVVSWSAGRHVGGKFRLGLLEK